MFDVWCVWWICHIVNSQLRKSAFTSTAKWWFAVFETTRSICVALHKSWRARIREGSCRVLHLTGVQRGPPPPQPSKITHLTAPALKHSHLSARPQQLNRGQIQNAWGLGFLICSISPTITLRDCLVWCAIAAKLSFKWEKSTRRRWKVGKKKNIQIGRLSSISSPIIGTNSFVHFDLLTSKLIWFLLSF